MMGMIVLLLVVNRADNVTIWFLAGTPVPLHPATFIAVQSEIRPAVTHQQCSLVAVWANVLLGNN